MYHDRRVNGPLTRLPGLIPRYRLLGSQTPPVNGIRRTLRPVSHYGCVPSVAPLLE
jgi:hypothetical protein